ncbi:hypothetical protein [Bacillus sp. UNC322MFChir4.1]|uniref:hypothetical protein n=1 Tax=Bacillus sp. UNC322MFChir4.1 TaxID=1449045 RepID=UPI000AAEAF9C|nr:hypothetical protein [Bacillus sp. UNC322MFChir4.1]
MEEALVLLLYKEIERNNNNVFGCSKKNRYDMHKHKKTAENLDSKLRPLAAWDVPVEVKLKIDTATEKKAE